jgi:hypothetical protein
MCFTMMSNSISIVPDNIKYRGLYEYNDKPNKEERLYIT